MLATLLEFLGAFLVKLLMGLRPSDAVQRGKAEEALAQSETANEQLQQASMARANATGLRPGKLSNGAPDPDCRDCEGSTD